jgi:Family of unknown function (DUF5343)
MIEAGAIELDEDRRPYAPAANVVAALDRIRRVNLPDLIDVDFLRIAQVPEGTQGRVLQALRFLRLVDVTGRPADRLRALARAADDEYRDLLASVIREAYASDFARIDPAQDTQSRIMSAFQRYEPRSQTYRMAMLFLGLCRAAGIPVLDAPRERQMQARPGSRPKTANGGIPQPARAASRAPSRANVSMPAIPDQLGSIPSLPSPLLFGVTVDDIGSLDAGQFKDVWDALGVIARARAMSQKALRDTAEQAANRRENEAQEAQEGEPDQ